MRILGQVKPWVLLLILMVGAPTLHALANAPGGHEIQPFPSSEIKAIREVRLEDDRSPMLPTIGRERLQAFRDAFQSWVLGFLDASKSEDPRDLSSQIQTVFEAAIKEVDRTNPPPQSTEMPNKYNYFNGAVAGRFSVPHGHKNLLLFTGIVEDQCGQDGLVYLFFKKGDGSWSAWSAYPDPPHGVVEGMGEMPEVRIGAPDGKGHFLLVTAHYVPWFQSTWRVIHLDSWILDRVGDNMLALEKHRSEHGIWIDPDPPFKLTLDGPRSFTARFRDWSMDSGRHSTGRTFRFHFDENCYGRIPPYGDTPEDFLEEWFRLPWNIASSLVAAPLLPKLKPLWDAFQAHKAFATLHEILDRDGLGIYSKQCRGGWRVGFDGWGPEGEGPSMTFILSRGRDGYLITDFRQGIKQ